MKKIENREYKSDVFSMLMEYPEYALNVYNVLNGTQYDDPELVEINTLQKGISVSIRNDASFIIGADLNIYEHQSTYNRNMPLRSLIYFAEIIKLYVEDKDIYGRKIIKIPTPKFVVFYNGAEKRPEIEIQKLSDAYDHDDDISIELTCTVYNINPDNNNNLKSGSYVLEGYTFFVEKVREYALLNDINEVKFAVSKAVDCCIENDILKEFFEERRHEVINNMTVDMTFETRVKIIRREEFAAGKAEGKAEGEVKGRLMEVIAFVKDGFCTAEVGAQRVGMTLEEFQKAMSEAK